MSRERFTSVQTASLPIAKPGDWRWSSADRVCSKITKGTTPKSSEVSQQGQIPFIRVNNLTIGGACTLAGELVFVTPQAHSGFLARSIAYPSDVLMNIVGPPLGKVTKLGCAFDEYNLNQAVLIYRTVSTKLSAEFFYFYLSSDVAQRWLDSRAKKTSGQKNLTIALCKELPVPLPPLPEQEKIAEILSTWDDAIQVVETLIENSGEQRQALIKRLIWGNERLPRFGSPSTPRRTKYGSVPTDWDFPALRDVAFECSDRNVEGEDLPVLACSKYFGFVHSLEYFKKKVYSDDTTNYKLVRRGSFGFPANHIEEGSIGYQNICDIGLVSPIYCVFRTNDNVWDGYLYRLLKTDHYRQIFAASTNSSVDRRGSLRWKEFSKIHVPLPSLEEQRAISHVIDVADHETRCLERKLEVLRAEKQALMQQLLTGKRRVRVDEAVESAYA